MEDRQPASKRHKKHAEDSLDDSSTNLEYEFPKNAGLSDLSREPPIVLFTAAKPKIIVDVEELVEAVELYRKAFDGVKVAVTSVFGEFQSYGPEQVAELKLGLRGSNTRILVANSKFWFLHLYVAWHVDQRISRRIFVCLETDHVDDAMARALSAGGINIGYTSDKGFERKFEPGKNMSHGYILDPYSFVWEVRKKPEIGMVSNSRNDLSEESQDTGIDSQMPLSFTAVYPKLLVDQASNAAIDYYKKAFGAVEVGRRQFKLQIGKESEPLLLEAQLKIGSSTILVAEYDSSPTTTYNDRSDGKKGAVMMCLETENFDSAMKKTAILVEEKSDCEANIDKVRDRFGFDWQIRVPKKESEY